MTLHSQGPLSLVLGQNDMNFTCWSSVLNLSPLLFSLDPHHAMKCYENLWNSQAKVVLVTDRKINTFHSLVIALSPVEESSFKEPPSVILRFLLPTGVGFPLACDVFVGVHRFVAISRIENHGSLLRQAGCSSNG